MKWLSLKKLRKSTEMCFYEKQNNWNSIKSIVKNISIDWKRVPTSLVTVAWVNEQDSDWPVTKQFA